MDVTRMSTEMLWAEKDALQDIAECGQSTGRDRAYYAAICAEINVRLAAEGLRLEVIR